VGRVLRVLIAIDETANTVFGGKPTETISGTVGRAAQAGSPWATRLAAPLVDALFGAGHCWRQATAEALRRKETAPWPSMTCGSSPA
jgi:hypothetical protein